MQNQVGVQSSLVADGKCFDMWHDYMKLGRLLQRLSRRPEVDQRDPERPQEEQAASFILENIVLDKHVRYILIVYPVVIWALAGNLDKNFDAKSPTRNGIFIEETEEETLLPHKQRKDDTKTQKAQSNGLVTEGNHDCELESPPTKITFSKSMRPSHKNKVEGTCKASSPVEDKTRNKPQTPVVEGKTEPARQENSTPPAKEASRPATPEKHKGTVHSQSPAGISTRGGKDKTSFLQRLRQTNGGQPKPACFRKLSPVKVPSLPPEPEDDFLILEDDTPLWFSIPSKTATSKRVQQSRTASTDKNSSTDKGTEDRPLETVQKEDNQKMKKMKGKEKNEPTQPGNDEDDLVSPENLPVSDEVEPAKPNKKKQQLLKTSSKEGDRVKDSPNEEKLSQKVGKKAPKSSETKSFKNSKNRKENAKTSRAKSLKGTEEVMQEPEDMKDMKNNERDSDVRDFGCLTDSGGAEDLAGGKAKGNKLLGASEGSSSEEGQSLGKRKRKQTGQWWLSSQGKEETKATNNPPTVKKSKQHRKEPRAAEPSPVKAKDQSTVQAKEKKPKRDKNRPARGGTPVKRKATRQVFNTNEAEERDEQQQQQQQRHLIRTWILSSRALWSSHTVISVVPQGIRYFQESTIMSLMKNCPRHHNIPLPEDLWSSSLHQNQGNERGDLLVTGGSLMTCLKTSQAPPLNLSSLILWLKDLRSGPSSMIELDQYEENDMILPSSRASTALSVSDLCAPPLRPLTLQPKDKANLTDWLKSLWSTTVNNGSDITPDQFDWYFYQGRAIGILADLSCGSICNGKILLGSYMKKPLWVDHSATTVFNILTSSVSVTIDGTKSFLNSGQSFMVECGHAYSIQNVTALPAVLCFTRIYAETSD
ncbi:hypothetical protein INR49_014825 [Caranx melampygus]|nr:hypothetical protein INR49_014825 [Caranx melampygus]